MNLEVDMNDPRFLNYDESKQYRMLPHNIPREQSQEIRKEINAMLRDKTLDHTCKQIITTVLKSETILSQQEIADHIGCSQTIVSRKIADIKKRHAF